MFNSGDDEIEKTRIETKKYRIRALRKRFYFAQIISFCIIIIILFCITFYVYLDPHTTDIVGTVCLVLALFFSLCTIVPIRILKRSLRIEERGLCFSGRIWGYWVIPWDDISVIRPKNYVRCDLILYQVVEKKENFWRNLFKISTHVPINFRNVNDLFWYIRKYHPSITLEEI